MTDDEFERWVTAARAETQRRMTEAQRRFGLGSHARYELDLADAVITFFDASGAARVKARVQVAGTWSPNSETWLWSWENESVPAQACESVQLVRHRGEREGVSWLQASVVECDEGMAWSLASLAAHLLDAQAVYRTASAKSRVFLLLFEVAEL